MIYLPECTLWTLLGTWSHINSVCYIHKTCSSLMVMCSDLFSLTYSVWVWCLKKLTSTGHASNEHYCPMYFIISCNSPVCIATTPGLVFFSANTNPEHSLPIRYIMPITIHSQSVTNIQVGQEFVSWSNVSLTNIFVNWLTFNNGFDQDILVKC